MTTPVASRSDGPMLNADTQRGFIVRFALIAALLVFVPWVANILTPNTGMLRFAPLVAAWAIVVIAFLWWRIEALLAFALFVLFVNTLMLYMGSSLRQFDEVTVPALTLIALRWGVHWRRWWWWPRELALGLALVAGVVSSLVQEVPLDVWGIQLALVVKAIAIFYVALWIGARVYEIAAGMKVVLAIGAVIMALGLVELFNPPLFQRTLGLDDFLNHRGPLFAVKSLFFHPVLFSWFTAFIALYAYAWYLVGRQRRALVVAAIFSFGPFLGQRRRAILALIAGVVAAFAEFMARRRTDWRRVVASFAPVGATLVIILVLFIPMLANLWESTITDYIDIPPTETGQPSSGDAGEAPPQVRIALYIGAAEVAVDHFPFGGGLGRWGSYMSRTHYSPLYQEYDVDEIRGLKRSRPINATDTFWPQILGELGFLGAAAYIGFMASLAIGLWRVSARYRTGIPRIFTLGTGMILVQAVVESLASPMFHSPPRAYLVYLVIGLATAMLIRAPDDWVEMAVAEDADGKPATAP